MKKIVKVLFVFLLVPVVLVSCAIPACADLIWEPNDEFYEVHREECCEVKRVYKVSGGSGSVELLDAPNGTVIQELHNGEHIWIYYSWSDGAVTWGYLEAGSDQKGWVRMEDMLLMYDGREFMQDHKEEIESVSSFVKVEFQSVKLFRYPNGPEEDAIMFDDLDEEVSFSTIYTDDAGLQWGYVSRLHGEREKWICIDEPMIEGAAERKYVHTPQQEQAAASRRQTTLILAAVLVAVVVLISAVLIHKLPKRKRASQ